MAIGQMVWLLLLFGFLAWWLGAFDKPRPDPLYILRRVLIHLWEENDKAKARGIDNGPILDAVQMIIRALDRMVDESKAPRPSVMP